jgi:xylose isomerase
MEKRKLSMPFWCVANPVGDPFGGHVMDRMSSVEICDLLCKAKKDNLIDYTSAHDDNLVDWDPENSKDDLDPDSETSKTLREIKTRMDRVALKMMMVTCDLHDNTLFRNGGLTNPDPEIRVLAAQKVMRTIRIGHFFGAQYLTYWVARDGFETPFALPWENTYRYLVEGLNLATRYIRANNFSIKNGTIESKPNEPRGEMLLPTTGHALALIDSLEEPSFWGVNPELLQHEGMTLLSPFVALALAIHRRKLFFVHLGNQKPGQFDNDSPTMIGMSGVKETVGMFWLLDKLGWQGHFEFDNHILRSDTAPGKENATKIRMDFIRYNVENVRMAEKKAQVIKDDKEIRKAQEAIWEGAVHLARMLSQGDTQGLLDQQIDVAKVDARAVDITGLDTVVNRRLLGL